MQSLTSRRSLPDVISFNPVGNAPQKGIPSPVCITEANLKIQTAVAVAIGAVLALACLLWEQQSVAALRSKDRPARALRTIPSPFDRPARAA
jgi:hypothetical protein